MGTTAVTLTLLGLGLGTLIAVGKRSNPRGATTLRERAIEAQRTSARASQVARDLAARALEETR